MSSGIISKSFTPSRRELLLGAAALSTSALISPSAWAQQFPTAKVNTTGLAVTDTEVTVGILHSVTGTMAISETGSVQAEKLAIEQINAAGGVLGRKIKFIQEDGAQRLADIRREGEEAPGQRQGRVRDGLLDLGLAQGGAAGVRAIQRHALLSDLLRRARSLQERHLHRPGGDAADHRRPRLGAEGEGRQDLLSARLRLHLAAHLQQDRAQAHRELPQAQGVWARNTSRSATLSSIPSSTRSSSRSPT